MHPSVRSAVTREKLSQRSAVGEDGLKAAEGWADGDRGVGEQVWWDRVTQGCHNVVG